MASRTCFLVASVHSTSGRRSLALAWPKSSAPYFTGAGLVSTNSALCSGIRRSWISNTLSRSRFFQASCMSPHSRGAMLAVAEMRQEAHGARILARELQEALLGLELGQGRPRHVVARVLDADDVAHLR